MEGGKRGVTAAEQRDEKGQGLALAAMLLLLVIVTLYGILKWTVRLPERIADSAVAIDHLFLLILTITGTIFVLAHLYLAVAVWRFRFREGIRSAFIGIHRKEWLWVLVPIVILLAADLTFDHKSNHVWSRVFWQVPEDAFRVEVTGEQFAWNIRYPGKDGKFGRTDPKFITNDNPLGIDKTDPASRDDIFFPAGQGELHIPVNKPVVFLCRAKDVLHSFFVPFARLKQDCVPGMTTRIWFTPTKTGTYEFACAELCGLGHYRMRGVLVVEPMEKVKKWLDEQPTFSDLVP